MRLLVILVSLATLLAIAPLSLAAERGSVTATVSAHSSAYGKVLFDGRGFALYAFTRDPRGRSACSGDCAKAWPPYLVKGRPTYQGPASRGSRRTRRAARHHSPQRRLAAGHLRRSSALLRRPQAGSDPLSEHLRVRRSLARGQARREAGAVSTLGGARRRLAARPAPVEGAADSLLAEGARSRGGESGI